MAASMIFGLETSLYLRILLNMLGLAYGLLLSFCLCKNYVLLQSQGVAEIV